jgi:uncharacterized BrkB/YihY/UPF0761 family membrane protein
VRSPPHVGATAPTGCLSRLPRSLSACCSRSSLLVALIVSLLQLVLPADVIDSFVSWLMGELAGSPEVEASVARALVGARGTATVVTFVALGALIWGASGMMSAMRYAFVGYGWYLTQISDVAVVYRSLAGLLGFLLVVYVGVLALLFGAELVASGAARV